MVREFLAPQVTISATRISPYAPMLIRVEPHRSLGELFGPTQACPEYLSHNPIPITDTRCLWRICWMHRDPDCTQ